METASGFLRILNVKDALLILFAYANNYYCYCGSSGSTTIKIIKSLIYNNLLTFNIITTIT